MASGGSETKSCGVKRIGAERVGCLASGELEVGTEIPVELFAIVSHSCKVELETIS